MCRTGGSAGPERLTLEYNTVDLGILYRISEAARIGLMVKNIFGFSFNNKYDSFSLSRYLTLGISNNYKKWTFSFDSEFIFGEFGGLEKKTARIWLLRSGLEYELGRYFRLRSGLIYPVFAWSSSLGDLLADAPWPKMGGAVGLGLELPGFSLDLALYGDPGKAYVEKVAAPAITGTLTLKF